MRAVFAGWLCLTIATQAFADEASFVDTFETFDTERWYISDGWSNGSHQSCTWSNRNVRHENAQIILSLTDEQKGERAFSCAEIQTKAFFGYGTYEVRMKAAAANPESYRPFSLLLARHTATRTMSSTSSSSAIACIPSTPRTTPKATADGRLPSISTSMRRPGFTTTRSIGRPTGSPGMPMEKSFARSPKPTAKTIRRHRGKYTSAYGAAARS